MGVPAIDMVMKILPEYSCYCKWDHAIFSYGDYLRVRNERKKFLEYGGKAIHLYRDNVGRLIFIDKTFEERKRQGYVSYPLTAIKPRT